MKETWQILLSEQLSAEFGDSPRAIALKQFSDLEAASVSSLQEHQQVAADTFDAMMLVLRRANAAPPAPAIAVAKQVCSQLFAQIAQDITAIRRLAAAGFAYQAVSLAASTFEHAMMLASIASENARAQKWLTHVNQQHNIDNVKDRVQSALTKLDRDNPGLKACLGNPYEGMYKPLCTFKHGNPVVQKHIASREQDTEGFSVFPITDRRSLIASYWALEAAIRSGWIGLVSLVGNHVANREGLSEIINGVNRAFNALILIRKQVEQQPGAFSVPGS